jgi:hypothetical protein
MPTPHPAPRIGIAALAAFAAACRAFDGDVRDVASGADAGPADRCATVGFTDGFDRDPRDVRGAWTDLTGNNADATTQLAIASTASKRGAGGLAVTLDTTGFTDRGRYLVRQVGQPACIEATFAIRPRTKPPAGQEIVVLTFEERASTYFAVVLTSNGLALVEHQVRGSYSELARASVPDNAWSSVALRVDTDASRVTWQVGGTEVDLKPLALAHQPPDEVRLGAVYAGSGASGAFDLDDFELR